MKPSVWLENDLSKWNHQFKIDYYLKVITLILKFSFSNYLGMLFFQFTVSLFINLSVCSVAMLQVMFVKCSTKFCWLLSWFVSWAWFALHTDFWLSSQVDLEFIENKFYFCMIKINWSMSLVPSLELWRSSLA